MEALLGLRRVIIVAVICLAQWIPVTGILPNGTQFSIFFCADFSSACAQSSSGQLSNPYVQQPMAGGTRLAQNPGQLKNAYKVDAEKAWRNPEVEQAAQGVFHGQDFQTANFYVRAGNANLARKVGEEAERFRRELSIQWIGHELENWEQPCPIEVNLSSQAHGETSFMLPELGSGMPSDWDMKIYGPVDRLLDSVLPHEITHTIFATHFKQRLPRWVDEGACTMVEHASEKQKIHSMLLQYLSPNVRKGLPFNRMFILRDYPADHHGMLALYAQGFSVSKYLIAQGGHQHFAKFILAGLENENRMSRNREGGIHAWTEAVDRFYHYDTLSDLQLQWIEWVQEGSHETEATDRYVRINRDRAANLASLTTPANQANSGVPASFGNGNHIATNSGENLTRSAQSNMTGPAAIQQQNLQGLTSAGSGSVYQRIVRGEMTVNQLGQLENRIDSRVSNADAVDQNQYLNVRDSRASEPSIYANAMRNNLQPTGQTPEQMRVSTSGQMASMKMVDQIPDREPLNGGSTSPRQWQSQQFGSGTNASEPINANQFNDTASQLRTDSTILVPIRKNQLR